MTDLADAHAALVTADLRSIMADLGLLDRLEGWLCTHLENTQHETPGVITEAALLGWIEDQRAPLLLSPLDALKRALQVIGLEVLANRAARSALEHEAQRNRTLCGLLAEANERLAALGT